MSDSNESSAPDADPIPPNGRIIGVDFGTRRIGVAISDPGQSIASPLEIRHSQNQQSDGEWFLKLVEREKAVGFVVGLPVHMSGDQSQKSREAIEFGRWLGDLTGLPISWQDERYSTATAKEICAQLGLRGDKRKAHLDKIAAQVILSSWLEREKRDDSKADSLLD